MSYQKLFPRFAFIFLLILTSGCTKDSESSIDRNEPSSWILRWNKIAVDASGYDHTPTGGHEQLGPTKASRAMAIVHIAMFDAVNSISPRYENYLEHGRVPRHASLKAAVAQAAHDTLRALYPSQQAFFDNFLAEDLAHIEDESAREAGVAFGSRVASNVLEVRTNDGSEDSSPENEAAYAFSSAPGHWNKDPLNPGQRPLGTLWDRVEPFVLTHASQFRVPAPPRLQSSEYAAAYQEVFRLGGDGVITPTERTNEQSEIGIFWAYDGTPSLCAPPRLYNQIAVQIAKDLGTEEIVELARLLALVNVAMADAGIAIWESKYYYDFWRPVTAIRTEDGNSLTATDSGFVPLGAPASNAAGKDFTPPFPSYPSGHAGFGGALFQILRNFYGTDAISFDFVSDEFNGETRDAFGNTRPKIKRHYDFLSQAEEENGQSRIYLGIHFSFDKTEGIAQGRNVANYVFANAFQPR